MSTFHEHEKVSDSPTGWVADHIRGYVESDGANGHDFHGSPTLLLTTRGRRSGQLRRTALIYGTDGDTLLLIASNAGATVHPAWYLNLVDEPTVGVQVGADTFTATARTAGTAEKAAKWSTMTALMSEYDDYERTSGDRDLPMVVLNRR